MNLKEFVEIFTTSSLRSDFLSAQYDLNKRRENSERDITHFPTRSRVARNVQHGVEVCSKHLSKRFVYPYRA